MQSLKRYVGQLPVAGPIARAMYRVLKRQHGLAWAFPGSANYWEGRYHKGGSSGVGSYGKFAEFKADVLNAFVVENGIDSVIEFGCGDGNQLKLAKYPQYLGIDVSETAVASCRRRFPNDRVKRFCTLEAYKGETAELALSLDVIYHLVEDDVFESYMQRLFDSATRFVAIYSSNTEDNQSNHANHVRHREFSNWVANNASGWSFNSRIPNKYPYSGDYREGSFADFYFYERE